jgi:hypothetical protein
MPQLSNWIAPTLSVEEIDKRIGELKAVQFWLDQNAKALAATIQALEVQKMTLATLKGMNFSMGEVANAFKLKPEAAAAQPAAAPAPTPAPPKAARKKAAAPSKAKGAAAPNASGVVDPLQWWGALTQQFQQIATNAMKDAATQTAVDAAKNMAGGMAKEAMKAAKKPARKRAAKK